MPIHPLISHLRQSAHTTPLIAGHRGAAAVAAENTLTSFEAAVTAGCEIIEFDVRETADGEWICLHDPTLERTTNAGPDLARTPVYELPWSDIRHLDAGGHHRNPTTCSIPTLAEAIRCITAPVLPMIEHKSGAAASLVDALESLGVMDRVMVQSFDWTWLREFRRLAPDTASGALAEGPCTPARVTEILEIGTDVVHWNWPDLTIENTERLRDLPQMSCVYTADAELTWLGLARAGVDAIVTNDPARMAAARPRLTR